ALPGRVGSQHDDPGLGWCGAPGGLADGRHGRLFDGTIRWSAGRWIGRRDGGAQCSRVRRRIDVNEE
ncbi:MAG: hypothetical protein N3I86_11935, partial [Verrucomicrobiae bacterium]|nr:hypothetical protein [Verrucomicrobiae bacterium]